jgi:hypothetical protein
MLLLLLLRAASSALQPLADAAAPTADRLQRTLQ